MEKEKKMQKLSQQNQLCDLGIKVDASKSETAIYLKVILPVSEKFFFCLISKWTDRLHGTCGLNHR